MTQEQIQQAMDDFNRVDVKEFDLVIPHTKNANDVQDKLFRKFKNHRTNDMTTKLVGFDVSRSSFAIETLPKCSTSPEFKLRCILLFKGIKQKKNVNLYCTS